MSGASLLSRGALAAALIVLGIAGCSNSTDVITGHAAEVYRFDSAEEMVATSDAVVQGTVLTIAKGRTAGAEDAGHSLNFKEVTLRVDEVLYGTSVPSTVVLEEAGTQGGKPVIINNVQPSQDGDSGIYFLVLLEGNRDEPRYRVVNSQGRYLIVQSDQLEGSDPEDPLVQELQSRTPEELKGLISEAAEAVERGEVEPQPDFCCESPTPSDGVSSR